MPTALFKLQQNFHFIFMGAKRNNPQDCERMVAGSWYITVPLPVFFRGVPGKWLRVFCPSEKVKTAGCLPLKG